MDRTFDYTQKILLAVEFAAQPTVLTDMPKSYALFQRLGIPEVLRAFDEKESLFVKLIAGRKFHHVLDQHMSYWEKRVPAGQHCFVHYAIGTGEAMQRTFARLQSAAHSFVLLGVYHLEPQSSSYPFGFPTGETPDHWRPSETRNFNSESIFWFNFFPAQKHLFEKTFAIWLLFNMFQERDGGVCNQLVARDESAPLVVNGVDPFAQVNLNRFTNLVGYFNSAADAGKHTFTVDENYFWHGMLLHKIELPATHS